MIVYQYIKDQSLNNERKISLWLNNVIEEEAIKQGVELKGDGNDEVDDKK